MHNTFFTFEDLLERYGYLGFDMEKLKNIYAKGVNKGFVKGCSEEYAESYAQEYLLGYLEGYEQERMRITKL